MTTTDHNNNVVGRRGFLQLLGGAIAVPSLSACTRQPKEEIVPFVQAPEDVVPGRPLFYATATLRDGVATGVLVEAHMGRPTKIEGNPEHPGSLGGTDAIQQAEILQLYDPDRSQTVTKAGQISSWGSFVGAIQAEVLKQKSKRGAGLRIITGDFTSPTLLGQITALLAEMPQARWTVHAPVGRGEVVKGSELAYGAAAEPQYQFDKADVILSLDADFLGSEGSPRYIRNFAQGRKRGQSLSPPVNRLYVIESQLSLTGANADHRIAMRAGEVEHAARLLAKQLAGDEDIGKGAVVPQSITPQQFAAIARDLKKAGKRAVVVPGRFQPPAVHAAAAVIEQGHRQRGGELCARDERDIGVDTGAARQRRGRLECGQSRAVDHSRLQSGLQRARRLRVRERDAEGDAARAPGRVL